MVIVQMEGEVWGEPGFEWWSEEKGGGGPIDKESVRVGYLDGEVGPGVEKGWWSTDRRRERARAFS